MLYRDEEVVWENVGCLKSGEMVSLTGTHLGHNVPDRTGNRYCINIVAIAGYPV
jgi:peptide methionine sulfoxide reductase MsrB